ncbi:MAG: hypothetical protein FWF83_07945 [Clostridiales bacterium]|nr:hypothetical protein [Clostridiales bacterium]
MNRNLTNFNDFMKILLASGFSIGGGNDEGVFAIVDYDWLTVPLGTPIVWHTGDPETDPWEWRIRVLNERIDIAYSKCFFRKSGYITQSFYPYFLALRRGGREFGEEYADGALSFYTKRIYDVIREYGELPLDEIKKLGGFAREEKGKFDSALTELQMRLYLTVCGTRRRVDAQGMEYGWETTVFSTTERFWMGTDVFPHAVKLSEAEAYETIRDRVLELNPGADEKKIRRFAYGR